MQLILDNMLATVITGMIFLSLVALNQRQQEQTMDEVNRYALKQQELTFSDILRQDLHNVTQLYTAAEMDSAFIFRRKNPNTALTDTTTVLVKYKRVFMSTRLNDFTGLTDTLYQIKRLQGSTEAAMASSGGSMVTVTEWTIQAETPAAVAVAQSDLSAAKQVFVRFEAAGIFKNDQVVQLSRWEATFRPPMLFSSSILL